MDQLVLFSSKTPMVLLLIRLRWKGKHCLSQRKNEDSN